MRDIGQELPSHVIDPGLLIQIPLKFIVRRLQFRDRCLKRLAHPVKMIAQLADLIQTSAGILGVKVKVCHPLGQNR